MTTAKVCSSNLLVEDQNHSKGRENEHVIVPISPSFCRAVRALVVVASIHCEWPKQMCPGKWVGSIQPGSRIERDTTGAAAPLGTCTKAATRRAERLPVRPESH